MLLLDCSKELESSLVRQGFDVDAGEAGFSTGIRRLPKQIYEYNIIIYNPTTVIARPDGRPGYIERFQIQNATPEFDLNMLGSHVRRGAIVLAFIKQLVADNQEAIRRAYSWIPGMPVPDPTSDTKIISNVTNDYLGILSPIVSDYFVKKPVEQKLPLHTSNVVDARENILYQNLNNDPLGLFIGLGYGEIILLPDCESNEEVINDFLKRVAPKILTTSTGTKTSLVDIFKSPEEAKIENKIVTRKEKVVKLESETEDLLEKANLAKAGKIKRLTGDATVKLVIKYYNLATEQPDTALFYLYKIVDALKKKYGSEKTALDILNVSKEWKYISTVANASYGDVRHAPMPEEPLKEWSDKEIEECFEDARKIIYSYFKTLF